MVIQIHLFSKLFLDLRRTAAHGDRSFVFKTHGIATFQLQGSEWVRRRAPQRTTYKNHLRSAALPINIRVVVSAVG